MGKHDIVIKNCNSIDHAELQIIRNSLNVKYGPNGIGKSTVARAIVSAARNDGTLEQLMPFKYRGLVASPPPEVSGLEDIRSALVFDEEYVNQFVFQQDEVVKNSFDIFVKTPEYLSTLSEIETALAGIHRAFAESVEIEQTIRDLRDLRDAFGNANKDGSLPKNSKFIRSFGSGNKIINIPERLTPFQPFIRGAEPARVRTHKSA